jgi:tRNA(Ile)-lysidine synthase
MIKQVESFVEKHALFRPGDRVLVGVSGGADSVCLLRVLHDLAAGLQIQLSAAHLHHGIRGRTADRDALLVKRLCAQLGISLQTGRADVPGLARSRGISLEMAAREARHDFFRRAAREAGARVVATAHTADDQVETLLLRLARGAGVGGLAGIAPISAVAGLTLVHPLLTVDRVAIIEFLRKRRAAWCEDETNRDTTILRNRVRHEILPMLETKLNPAIRLALLRAADILREESNWLDKLAREVFNRCRSGKAIRMAAFAKHPVAARRRVLRLWMTENGVPAESMDFDLVERLAGLAAGSQGTGQIELPGGQRAVKTYGALRIDGTAGPKNPAAELVATEMTIPGVTFVPGLGWHLTARLAPGLHKDVNRRPGHLPARASLSAAAIRGRRLCLRAWQPGDRMKPFGLGGSRKLQDIFTDAKIPAAERRCLPVVECAGEIIWLPGYRVAAGWEVKDPAKPALQLVICRPRAKTTEPTPCTCDGAAPSARFP